MQTLTWIGGLLKLMIFFSSSSILHHLSSILTIPTSEETRDTIRRLKQGLSFSRRHYSRMIITFFFFFFFDVFYLFNFRKRRENILFDFVRISMLDHDQQTFPYYYFLPSFVRKQDERNKTSA